MAKLVNNSRNKYTIIDNVAVLDERLSLKSLGLLVKLLSLPNNWEFSESGLNAIFKNDGKTSIKTAIKELERFGYLKRKQLRNDKGQLSNSEWIISEVPMKQRISENNPSAQNQTTDFQPSDNVHNINTNQSNTNKQSTKAATTAPSCEIESFWCEVTGTKALSKNMKKNFNFYRVQGCTDELILYALKKMDEAGAHSWAYAKKILDDAVANKTFTEEDFVKNKRGQYKGRNIPISREMPSKTTNYLADAMTRKRHLKRRD